MFCWLPLGGSASQGVSFQDLCSCLSVISTEKFEPVGQQVWESNEKRLAIVSNRVHLLFQSGWPVNFWSIYILVTNEHMTIIFECTNWSDSFSSNVSWVIAIEYYWVLKEWWPAHPGSECPARHRTPGWGKARQGEEEGPSVSFLEIKPEKTSGTIHESSGNNITICLSLLDRQNLSLFDRQNLRLFDQQDSWLFDQQDLWQFDRQDFRLFDWQDLLLFERQDLLLFYLQDLLLFDWQDLRLFDQQDLRLFVQQDWASRSPAV